MSKDKLFALSKEEHSARSILLIAGEAKQNCKFSQVLVWIARSLLARRSAVRSRPDLGFSSSHGVEVSFCSAFQTLNEGLNVFGETLHCIVGKSR